MSSPDPVQKRKAFLREVVELVARLGGIDFGAAEEMSQWWLEFSEDDEFLYTETSYYYAMSILHHLLYGDNDPLWYLDPNKAAPPAWVVKWLKHRH